MFPEKLTFIFKLKRYLCWNKISFVGLGVPSRGSPPRVGDLEAVDAIQTTTDDDRQKSEITKLPINSHSLFLSDS